MATVTKGPRKVGGNVQVIAYNGRQSLMALVSEAEQSYMQLLEVAAGNGWVDLAMIERAHDELETIALKAEVRGAAR